MSAKKEEKKVTTKKKVVAKKKVTKKLAPQKAPEMLSYSMRMVIPTGDYANIQPEIVVKAGSADEAHAFIAPHMNKLWKEYFNISKRRVEPEKKAVPVTPKPTVVPVAPKSAPIPVGIGSVPDPETTVYHSPVSSVAMTKATQAIESCLSMDALNLIIEQVKVSVKLTDQDKIDLAGIIMVKDSALKVAEFDKQG